MASSSSGKKNYPLRLYEKGKTPIQKKSMNHNCHLSNLTMVKEAIGEDVWVDIRDSSVGVIIKLYQMDDYIWCAKTVHYFLTNQLAINKNHEIWSLIDGQPIRFSLYEFAEITGLNSDPFDGQDKCDVEHKEFWGELAVSPEQGPSLNELKLVLTRCRDWSFAKRRMVGLLCILSIGIFGISPGSRIPLACAKQVMDPDIFDRYPWGRFAFKSLMDSIKVVTFGAKNTYVIRGCVHVLLIWAYESVPALGKLYGNKKEGQEVPLVSWGGSRRRFEFDDLFAEEKKTYDKVRVRHLIVKPEEEIYPKWSEDKDDKVLDNLIKDIIHDRFGMNAWDAVVAKDPVTNMRKRKIHVNQSDEDNGAKTFTQKIKKHSCAATKTSKRNSKAVALADEQKFYCPICMCPFTEETTTKCGHIFCNSCIKIAISHQPNCPTCRKDVTATDLIRVFLPSTGCM